MTTRSLPVRTEPVLLARDVRKSYGPRVALQSVSLRLQAGELVALLGPNGAGKSTLVQLLSGLFVPDQGTIHILGHDLRTQAPRALAGLGVVFQQSALDLFHTDLHGIARSVALQRIAQGLQQHGLEAERNAPVRSLSGGNRRKVELVRALLHQPAFLLMDEATVGLDPSSRKALVDSVYALTRSGAVAALWATHLVDEVEQADRVIVL
ncbi:MAG: ATP-binding cassette domain-containing protein, partial [Betaproteobacteria bacterium]|nr:ATP-binding cassette domain-containing protein [Betaproteobacteria bacterium]